VAFIEGEFGRRNHEELAAARDWLACWGICEKHTEGSSYYPTI